MNGLLLALALGATVLSNYPSDAGGRIAHQAVALMAGGAPAVVVAAGERVVGFRADGSAVPGLTIPLGEDDPAAGPIAAADMDGDGRAEIAVVTASGKVHLWSGGAVPGFPVKLGARAKAGVSFGDVDGDGRPEVLVGDEKGRVHALKKNGREPTGWPASVGCVVTSTASSSPFAGGRSVAIGCEDGKVHVLDAGGRGRPGFPLVTRFSVTGAPAFADLDDDGEIDLLVASQDFGLYAVSASGQALPGFPVRAAYRLYEGPAVADLDGDRRLDVVFAAADGMVHAVTAGGERLRGFPVSVGPRLFTGPAVADLDRDGALDVVVVTSDGTIAAIDAGGKPLPGFPAPLSSADVLASPLVIDLAGDGTPAVFVGLPSGQLHAMRSSRPGTAATRVPWPAPGRDGGRAGRYGPNPPSYKELALLPAEPRATDVMKASWRGVWLDAGPGEPVPAPRIEWHRNGKPVPALEGKPEVPPGNARRGERWRFVLASARGDAVAQSPEVVVLDTAPSAPAVALAPAVPSRAAEVRATIAKPATDPDGDALRYEVTWLLDGLETGVTGEVFPGDRLRRDAVLAARVIAHDGELPGPAGVAQARVGDTPPGPVKIALEPAAPARTDVVRARVEVPATDLDGDALVYQYAWKVAGETRNLPHSASILPGDLFRKHQKIEVEVRAFDGTLAGPTVRAEATARNTAPTAPGVEIRPDRPRKGDPLRAVVTAPAADVDGDALTYRFSWRKNGQPFAAALADGREIPGAEVARGDVFELTVTASDGEVAGPAATALVNVWNTPPVPPRIALEPRKPKGGETIRLVVVEPATDVDGERVSLGVAWTREGKPTGSGADTLAPAQFRKHERVRVVVTPRDGEDPGVPAMDEVLVEDAAPGEPVVAFASDRPTVTAPLRVLVRTPAADPDGDLVRYQHRWILDGAAVALPDDTPESREPPFWTAVSEVPASMLRKGQRWAVEVRAHDGEKPGPAARAAVTVVNSPPPAPHVAFSPERPRRVDGIQVALEQPPDSDGDALTYRYTWSRNGERVDAPPEQAQIPRGVASKGQRWVVEVVASDGEAESPPVRREVVLADTAPGPTVVTLCDGPVPAGTVPQARIALAAADADGDAVSYRHEWTVNGKPVPSATGEVRLVAPVLRKHDRVRVTVTPWDGELAGPPAAAECEVVNTPPTAPAVALEPAEPTAPRGVAVAVQRPSTDRDGDPIVYRYAWSRDGVPVDVDGAAIPPATLRHGEVWRVEVTPFDGEAAGESVVLRTVVRNTPPPTPSVALVPAGAAASEALACDARAPERDADQEPVTIRYRWLRDDRAEPIAEGRPALPAGVLRRGERWRCEAWTADGTAESARASAELLVRNTPPAAPEVAIEPEKPRRGDELVCRVATAARDADGDPVSYSYAWTENDRPVPQPGPDPSRVAASRVAKGKRWRCTVTPTDGAAPGAAASAQAVVANSPPSPALARVVPAVPKAGHALRCEVTLKSEDPDGDAVRYRTQWQRNGLTQPFADTSEEVPPRLVKAGDRWRCLVTPTDGSEDGVEAGSEEALVRPEGDEPTAGLP